MARIRADEIAATLRKRIAAGQWAETGRIPPERDHAREFRVARNTVRRAFELPKEDGTITRHIGRDTFVNATRHQTPSTPMPRFVAVYTMKPEDLAAFRAQAKSEQEATDKLGLKAWKEWGERNAAAIVATDVMVGKTKRVTKAGIADARNQIAGFLIVEAADIAAAARLFQDHPHITVFPGDGIDVMPVVTEPPEDEPP